MTGQRGKPLLDAPARDALLTDLVRGVSRQAVARRFGLIPAQVSSLRRGYRRRLAEILDAEIAAGRVDPIDRDWVLKGRAGLPTSARRRVLEAIARGATTKKAAALFGASMNQITDLRKNNAAALRDLKAAYGPARPAAPAVPREDKDEAERRRKRVEMQRSGDVEIRLLQIARGALKHQRLSPEEKARVAELRLMLKRRRPVRADFDDVVAWLREAGHPVEQRGCGLWRVRGLMSGHASWVTRDILVRIANGQRRKAGLRAFQVPVEQLVSFGEQQKIMLGMKAGKRAGAL